MNLTDYQRKELMVFSLKSAGLNKSISDIVNAPDVAGTIEVVQLGLNINKFLCAEINDIRKLKNDGIYEVKCIAYRGGSGVKFYIIDATKGVAFEQ